MPEFLDGVEQGGGLTTVADVTVAGGAVTTLSSGTIILEAGKQYILTTAIVQDGAGTPIYNAYVDGDSANTYYSGTSSIGPNYGIAVNNDNRPSVVHGNTSAAGEMSTASYILIPIGTSLHVIGVMHTTYGSNHHRTITFQYDNGATLPTSYDVVSDVASKIGNGSRIIIKEL